MCIYNYYNLVLNIKSFIEHIKCLLVVALLYLMYVYIYIIQRDLVNFALLMYIFVQNSSSAKE